MAEQESRNGSPAFHREPDGIIFDTPEDQERAQRKQREAEQHEFNRSQVESNKGIARFTKYLVGVTFLTILVAIWQGTISEKSSDAAADAIDLQDIQMRQNRLNNARAQWMQSESLRQSQAQFDDTLTQMKLQTQAQFNAAKASQVGAGAAKSAATTANDALVVGNRPWIKLTQGILGPLTFNESRNGGLMAIMTIRNQMENVGASVALNVETHEELVLIDSNHTIADAIARRDKVCDLLRSPGQANVGTDEFPHDPFTDEEMVSQLMSDVNESARTSSTGQVAFGLIGCVSYRSSFETVSASRHQTRFFYFLGVPGIDHFSMQPFVTPIGTADQLRLIALPLYFDAD